VVKISILPVGFLCLVLPDKPQLVVKVARYGGKGVQMGERFIPTDENGQLLINYLGPQRTFQTVSITDILDGKIPKGTFKDRIVLVGATAMGTHDLMSTPFSVFYPGVEIHATVIENILAQNFLSKPRWSTIYDLFAIIILGISRDRPSSFERCQRILFAGGLFALHIMVAQHLFASYGVWLNIVYPLAVVAFTYTALTLYHYITRSGRGGR